MKATDSSRTPAAWEWHNDMPLENTLRLPARASRALILNRVDPETLEQPEVASWLADPATRIFGGGSNVVFVRSQVERTVRVAASRWWVESEDADQVDLVAEAGLGLDALVRETAARGWFGLEALAEIPGTVGAAPMQNVGAYGVELGDRVRWVDAWDRHEGAVRRLERDACDFRYRDSRFKTESGRWLILRVGLRLSAKPPADWPPTAYPGLAEAVAAWQDKEGRPPAAMSPLAYAQMITRVRLAKLPDWRAGLPGSAGSFFHNPVVSTLRAQALADRWPGMPQFPVEGGIKIPAGWLIEQADLRGYRDGAVGVSERHALVLQHYGGATGETFLRFAEYVRDRVRTLFDIELIVEPECVTD
ncbi:UDP-N-acetylmuramate dehydrogenase [Guyparkeria hydrothermalis]|uniref:UDP-N-acetylmuramate dehydrogenase n=1 Tax=Guyparkeria hydrothermalis TaxID=923 RepID=UPI002021B709|nr:UDP-N-acetylmuramate dehydrogenase [Guyparkeria hydrothermalis]MCL7743954.1 UDP-N-acetylmuramate dehydrogenase [Guyparkeria hydrothermalis]